MIVLSVFIGLCKLFNNTLRLFLMKNKSNPILQYDNAPTHFVLSIKAFLAKHCPIKQIKAHALFSMCLYLFPRKHCKRHKRAHIRKRSILFLTIEMACSILGIEASCILTEIIDKYIIHKIYTESCIH